MRKVDTSAITTSIGMPEKSGTLVHLQTAYTEAIAEVVAKHAGASYSTSIPYRMNGLINTAGSVTAGSIFYNGEIFLVDAFTLPSPANASIATTFFTDISADPVTFTDGTPRNVHQIRKIAFTTASGGLGFTYSQLVELGAYTWVVDNSSSSFTVTFDKPQAIFRSFVVSGGTTFTVNLDGTGAKDGVESVLMFQISSSNVSFTINSGSFIADLVGIGGFSNPLVMSLANNKYFVFRFKCFNPPPLGGTNSIISLTVTKHT